MLTHAGTNSLSQQPHLHGHGHAHGHLRGAAYDYMHLQQRGQRMRQKCRWQPVLLHWPGVHVRRIAFARPACAAHTHPDLRRTPPRSNKQCKKPCDTVGDSCTPGSPGSCCPDCDLICPCAAPRHHASATASRLTPPACSHSTCAVPPVPSVRALPRAGCCGGPRAARSTAAPSARWTRTAADPPTTRSGAKTSTACSSAA